MLGSSAHAAIARCRSRSRCRGSLDADRLLEPEHEPGPDGPDDRGRAALFPGDRVGQVALVGRVDVLDGPAADHVGDAVAQQLAPHHEHAWRAGPADELVRAEEHRVLVRARLVVHCPHPRSTYGPAAA